jgi:glycosyltransferase involved in cell wall biosynthesis
MPNTLTADDLVICVPTYRRPEQLAALLQSLLPELRALPALVIVGDNDCGESAPQIVDSFRAQWPQAVCVPVVERGIAQVRNALVREAWMRRPDWRWLLMLDDDGLVTPGWMHPLFATGEALKAHLVGGAVEGGLPPDAGTLARNSIFASRRRWPTGCVPTLNGAQNLAIARKTLALVGEPLFRREYGASGGEDYDLFRRTARSGGVMAWCDEAVVLEPAPAELLKARALLYRYASTGAYMARIDCSYDGLTKVWKQTLKGLCGAAWHGAYGTLRRDPNLTARSVLSAAHQIGRIGGLLGARSNRYASPTEVRD